MEFLGMEMVFAWLFFFIAGMFCHFCMVREEMKYKPEDDNYSPDDPFRGEHSLYRHTCNNCGLNGVGPYREYWHYCSKNARVPADGRSLPAVRTIGESILTVDFGG